MIVFKYLLDKTAGVIGVIQVRFMCLFLCLAELQWKVLREM